MRHIKRTLLGLLVGVLFALGLASAEDVAQNSLDAMNVVQQGALLNVKLTFKEPLKALPAAFSVAKPARIAAQTGDRTEHGLVGAADLFRNAFRGKLSVVLDPGPGSITLRFTDLRV